MQTSASKWSQHSVVCTPVLKVGHFPIMKMWTWPTCPSVDGYIPIHTMEYYSPSKRIKSCLMQKNRYFKMWQELCLLKITRLKKTSITCSLWFVSICGVQTSLNVQLWSQQAMIRLLFTVHAVWLLNSDLSTSPCWTLCWAPLCLRLHIN